MHKEHACHRYAVSKQTRDSFKTNHVYYRETVINGSNHSVLFLTPRHQSLLMLQMITLVLHMKEREKSLCQTISNLLDFVLASSQFNYLYLTQRKSVPLSKSTLILLQLHQVTLTIITTSQHLRAQI